MDLCMEADNIKIGKENKIRELTEIRLRKCNNKEN